MWISVPKRREYCIRHISCIHNLRLKTSKKERSFYHQKIMKGEKMVKGRNIKFCKRILSIVLAVVMTVGMMNFQPFVKSVKAASIDIYVLFDTSVESSTYPKLHCWGGDYDLPWVEPSTFTVVNTSASGTWYKTTLATSYDNLNGCPVNVVVNGGGDTDGQWVTLNTSDTTYYIVRTSSSSTQVTKDEAVSTYGLNEQDETEYFTFTVKDCHSGNYPFSISDEQNRIARLFLCDNVTGTEYEFTLQGDGLTWETSIPTTVGSNFRIERRDPDNTDL